MLNLATPIQETKAYRSIFAEGMDEGKAEDLKRLLKRRFNTLPPWAAQRKRPAKYRVDPTVSGL